MASWWGCGCNCGKDVQDADIAVAKSQQYAAPFFDMHAVKPQDMRKAPASEASTCAEDHIVHVTSSKMGDDSSLPGAQDCSPGKPTSVQGSDGGFADLMSPSSMVNTSWVELGELPEDVVEVLSKADRDRNAGYTFVAEQDVLHLVNRLTTEDNLDLLAKVKQTREYSYLIAALEDVNSLLLKLLDDDGWTLQKQDEKITVWTKPEPGTDLTTVRIAGLVEGSFDNFAAIGKEVALIKTWMPGIRESRLVKALNTFDLIGYYVWKFPLVTAREFLVEEANTINDVEGYCLTKRQPPEERDGVELPPNVKGNVRAEISNWCSFSAPCGDNQIFSVTVMNVDLKIPLPMRLVNYFSISMGFQSFKDLRLNAEKAQNPKSELAQCVADPNSAPFYSRMRSLEEIRMKKPIPCREEIIRTGWVKDPEDRKKIFNRIEGKVLVPM